MRKDCISAKPRLWSVSESDTNIECMYVRTGRRPQRQWHRHGVHDSRRHRAHTQPPVRRAREKSGAEFGAVGRRVKPDRG